MNERAKFELEQRVDLYQFYLSSYMKGLAFFLAITGVLLKFAVDNREYRSIFSWAGILCSLAALIPIIFARNQERGFSSNFQRLAESTGTVPINTMPFRMLINVVLAFWIVVVLGWLYIFGWLH